MQISKITLNFNEKYLIIYRQNLIMELPYEKIVYDFNT